ncbi:RHS repeat protein [Microlunatus ginsengisoli]|uniref:RHS repeat-associated core domain-containing protein n=1 Tax=Microlunatus ginsengisoli TaxID=363863 RepID=A0ABP7AIG7_9ACTN
MRRLSGRRGLRLLVIGALVVSLYVVVPALAGRLQPAAADQPVSGAFALGGGLGGSIDPRTGQFSISVPLITVASEGTSGVTYTLDWNQARAGAGVDRYGFGAGWSFGTTFIDTSGSGTVYPASGGAYTIDDDGSVYSNLAGYPLKDMYLEVPADKPAAKRVLPARRGIAEAVDYSYALHLDDGRTDYYDVNGNLIARTDRFGNRTDLTYNQISPTQWQPASIVDDHGLVTTFSYDPNSGALTVSAPARSDGVTASTVVQFQDNMVWTVTDPLGSVATFQYTNVSGSNDNAQYLNQVTGPSGATSVVGYQAADYGSSLTLVVAQTLDLLDGNGNKLTPTRTIDLNPNGDQHNYTGYPTYAGQGQDALFDSGDPDYTYSTRLSNGLASTLSTYDSAHRLIDREIDATDDPTVDPVMVQQQTMTYPTIEAPTNLPGNYFRPLTTAVTYAAKSGPNGITAAASTRTTTTSTQYDDHGRVTSKTDEAGTTTKTTYDNAAGHYGLVTSVVTTGSDGTRRTTTNTLSADGSVVDSTTRTEAGKGASVQPRTVTSYGYDDGVLTSRTVGWAKGITPPAGNGGGPATSQTTYTTTVDPAARTKTIKATVGAGTPAAQTTTTVLDLVTELRVSVTDPAGRVTSRTYDAGGRILSVTPPTGLKTSTAYTPATADDPATQTVTEADGHRTQTTFDPLGRVVLVTDNVHNSAFVTDVAARTVSSTTYSPDGSTVTSTDRLGRTSTVTSDALGRAIRRVGVTGVTQDATYDDGANTTTTSLTGDNATAPYQITQSRLDDLNREVSSRATYPQGSGPGGRPLFLVDPANQTTYDGIGRATAVSSANVTTVPSYTGDGGLATSTAIGPAPANQAPGDPVTSTTTAMLDSGVTARTLQQSGASATSGSSRQVDAAGNVTSLTDPNGKQTSYGYAADGRLLTRTDTAGTVTENVYDATTGQLTSASVTPKGGAAATTTYAYVPAGKPGAGKLASVTDATGTITYGYDADGHRTSIGYPDGSAATQTYADNGELASATDVTGAVTSYVYNTDGTLQSSKQVRGTVTLASVSYGYDGLARITTATRGNGLITTYAYTPDNLLASDVTTAPGAANGPRKQVEAHSYSYDRNHNLTRRTDTTADPGTCTIVCAPGASTYGTWTISYRYDAYQRLIGSAVYSGASVTGTARTTLGYTLDVAGNVVTTTRVTRTTGTRPTTAKLVTTDSYDAAGQLTGRQAGSTTTKQTFDANGRVLSSLSGTTYVYRPDGLLQSSSTKAGAATTYAYWADGTRRRATTVDPATGTSSVELHYAPDGSLSNDTTTLSAGANNGSATASYLVTAGRVARTLQPNTSPAGKITTAAAPLTTGAGVGYLLQDRHTSVTALVDSAGTVTNTYAYGDYGTPALLDGRPGRVIGAAAGVQAGRANPFQYDGAAVRALYTDPSNQTMITLTRIYDPAQGRFTSRDTANQLNRYVGFATNPVMKVDPSGLSVVVDTITDIVFCIAFAIGIVVTGGAAAVAGGAIIAGMEAGVEVAAAVIRTAIWQTVATAVQVIGMAAQSARLADDISVLSGGKHFFTDDQRQDLSDIATAAGSLAGAAGLASAGVAAAETTADAAHAAATGAEGTVADTEGVAEHAASQPETGDAEGMVSTFERPKGTRVSEMLNSDEFNSLPSLLDSNTGQETIPLSARGLRPEVTSQQLSSSLDLSDDSLGNLNLHDVYKESLLAQGLDPNDPANWGLSDAGEATIPANPDTTLRPTDDGVVTAAENGVSKAATLTNASQPVPGAGSLAADPVEGLVGTGGMSLDPSAQLAFDIPKMLEE